MRRVAAAVAGIVALVLAGAACGDDDDASTAADGATTTTEVDQDEAAGDETPAANGDDDDGVDAGDDTPDANGDDDGDCGLVGTFEASDGTTVEGELIVLGGGFHPIDATDRRWASLAGDPQELTDLACDIFGRMQGGAPRFDVFLEYVEILTPMTPADFTVDPPAQSIVVSEDFPDPQNDHCLVATHLGDFVEVIDFADRGPAGEPNIRVTCPARAF